MPIVLYYCVSQPSDQVSALLRNAVQVCGLGPGHSLQLPVSDQGSTPAMAAAASEPSPIPYRISVSDYRLDVIKREFRGEEATTLRGLRLPLVQMDERPDRSKRGKDEFNSRPSKSK